MKKKILFGIMLVVIPFVVCDAKKKVEQPKPKNPFGETFEAPCQVYDTDEEFAATGIFEGTSSQKQEVQKGAVLAAQELIRIKMKHSYNGMISEYSSSYGKNAGNDIERKMEAAGDRVIDQIINDSKQSCVKWSEVDDKGHITCYTSVIISKKETAQKISQEVEEMLSQDEKDRIGFNEQEYRKQMEERFKQYKEGK
ncbi:MAG: hypothetical protein MJ009_03950 [Paludibacteraceae bacterium]|nr:hypothetical protein [Paludibacteraceae bacterium]